MTANFNSLLVIRVTCEADSSECHLFVTTYKRSVSCQRKEC